MMNLRFIKLFNFLAFLCFLAIGSVSAEVSPDAGKKLFKNYCASCHAKDMKSNLTGPALGGTTERWESEEELYAWIRNSQAMIAAGNPRAVELWNQYKPVVMTSFEALTDEEIGSILAYVECIHDGSCGGTPTKPGDEPGVVAEDDNTMTWVYWGLALVLGLLTLMLARVISSLNATAEAKDGTFKPSKSAWQILTSRGVIGFLVFCLVILGGYTTVNKSIDLGRQQGYAPEQPIKFSHKTHAGLHKIECQYCHDGARRSKHSVIPAANTCMNCHKAIKVGSTYGTAELTKIYASVGYDPTSNAYIEDYDNKSEEELKEIYSKWIAANYLDKKGIADLDQEGVRVVDEQWTNIVNSLTNEQKKKVQGPIEWIRIHNLPDHVYFNHSQHVSVGKLECQTCHGPIEKMEVVRQHSPLSMGWCVNCHRETEVKFGENDYYQSYAKFHEEIQEGKREKVTVSDIGGLECQKCHY